MSAYGLQTFDVNRKVIHFPTRSAIIGMLGAALGYYKEMPQGPSSVITTDKSSRSGESVWGKNTGLPHSTKLS